jgi:iron complex outermembrane receptor protein
MNNRIVTMSALALIMGNTSVALAQQAAGGLEEVIITAERRSASLQEVPVSVSALSAEGLENRVIQEAEDLQRFVPSLKMTNNITTPTNLSVSMRGSAVQDASLVVAESPFGIYIDDVYLARLNGNNATLSDIERVVVLRGPQGTLYGRNTVAGAVKFVTRDPGEESWFNASAGVGNWDQYKLNFSGGMQLNDSWAASLSGQITEKDGQFDNVATGQEVGLERNTALRGKLRYTGSDTFDAVASLSWSKAENDALQQPPGVTPTVPGDQVFESDDVVPVLGDYKVSTPSVPRQPAFRFPEGTAPGIADEPFEELTQIIASLKLSWEIGGGTLESITAYVETDDDFTADFSGLGLIMAATNPVVDQYSQEFKFESSAMDGRLNYILGAYFFRETSEQPFSWQFITPTSYSFIESETDSIALFGQADYSITDNLTATVGLRWVEDEKDFSIRFAGLPSALLPVPAEDFVELSESYDAVTPRFAINYAFEDVGFIDSGMTYASASQGFKSGGFSGIAIFGLTDSRIPYFEETNWTYEFGIKADMFDNRLRVNANYFMSRTEDAQLNATVNGGASFPVQNAGDVNVDGLETEITWVPVDGLTLFANAAFMDGEFKNLDPGAAPAQSVILFNNPNPTPPQTPDFAYTVGFDYRVGLPFAGGSELMLGASYFASDEYFVGSTNDFIISAYDRVDAYVGASYGDNWDLRLSARNLTDETDIISGSRALGGFIYLPQREYMLSLTYRM